jgi:hypothetical protein
MTPSTTTSCSSDSELFEGFNHTELYQMARKAGLPVVPSMPNQQLVALLLGEEEPQQVVHELDRWRHGIMGFVIEHWRALETQLTCPAKSKDPRACFQCVDAQVVTCLVQNEPDLHLIRLHKKDE